MNNTERELLTVATHNGSFHLDELLALSTIKLVFSDKVIQVIRTRDESILKQADWVVDVGGIYDHETRRYDHHQLGSPIRDNEVPFAAFGLVWKHWGHHLCNNNAEMVELIDQEFVQMVDGPDNGFETFKSLVDGGRVPALSMLPHLWTGAAIEDETSDEVFNDLFEIVSVILAKLISTYKRKFEANDNFKAAFARSNDKRIIFTKKGDWPLDTSKYPDVLFIGYEDVDNQTWKAKCITNGPFECRCGFPIAWRGLRGEELESVSGIKGAEFVHSAGFLAVADSKSALELMCQKAQG